MKRTVIAALSLGAIGMAAISQAQASPGHQSYGCVARVLHSEQLPYAPIGYWLAKLTLEITPSNGPPFTRTFYNNVPLQGSSHRRGDTFRLRCDPASGNLS